MCCKARPVLLKPLQFMEVFDVFCQILDSIPLPNSTFIMHVSRSVFTEVYISIQNQKQKNPFFLLAHRRNLRVVLNEHEGTSLNNFILFFKYIEQFFRFIWLYLALSRIISVYFELSWSISVHLCVSLCILDYLSLSLTIFGYL